MTFASVEEMNQLMEFIFAGLVVIGFITLVVAFFCLFSAIARGIGRK